jgi:low affinity Fe/Cu permease
MERSAIKGGRVSRILHWIDEITSRPGAAMLVIAVLIVFDVLLAINGFSGRWQMGFATVAESITLVMLFVIQHTQSRQQVALQLKLDELIRASPVADDLLVHIELAEDAELTEREQGQIAHHESLRESGDTEIPGDENK